MHIAQLLKLFTEQIGVNRNNIMQECLLTMLKLFG